MATERVNAAITIMGLEREIANLRAKLEQARREYEGPMAEEIEALKAQGRRLAEAMLAYRARAYQYSPKLPVDMDKTHEQALDEALDRLATVIPPSVAERADG